MTKIVSHTHRSKPKKEAEQPAQEAVEAASSDDEVLRKTVDGVDINYIDFNDLPDADWPFG